MLKKRYERMDLPIGFTHRFYIVSSPLCGYLFEKGNMRSNNVEAMC